MFTEDKKITRCFDQEKIVLAVSLYKHDIVGFYPDLWVKDMNNIALEDEVGNISLFEVEDGTVATGHYFFKKAGKQALISSKNMINELFSNDAYNVHTIRGLTPIDNIGALRLSKKLGFKDYGLVHTSIGQCKLFILTKEEWYNESR